MTLSFEAICVTKILNSSASFISDSGALEAFESRFRVWDVPWSSWAAWAEGKSRTRKGSKTSFSPVCCVFSFAFLFSCCSKKNQIRIARCCLFFCVLWVLHQISGSFHLFFSTEHRVQFGYLERNNMRRRENEILWRRLEAHRHEEINNEKKRNECGCVGPRRPIQCPCSARKLFSV